MKKKWQMIKRIREIKARFKEIADLCETEKRSMTDAEKEEKQMLENEMNVLNLRILQADAPSTPETQMRDARERAFDACVRFMRNGGELDEEYRSLVQNGGMNIPLNRTIQDAASAASVVPLTIGEIIEPLEKGLIFDKVGCKIQYGMTGSWIIPVVGGGVIAKIEGENVKITDSKVNLTGLKPSPKRVTIAIPVSNRAIDQSNGVILEVVRKQLVMGVARLLNQWMFSKTQLPSASDGCFVQAFKSKVAFVGEIPTWKEVLQIEAKAFSKGVVPDATLGWVCDASTFANLKATPKDAGSGRFIVEDGKIDGYPVHITEDMDKGALGFGVFSYELIGQFGEMRMTVDSTSAAVAQENKTYFVFNSDFDLLTLRGEAFAVGQHGA